MNLAGIVAVISLVAAFGNSMACILIVPQICFFDKGSDNHGTG